MSAGKKSSSSVSSSSIKRRKIQDTILSCTLKSGRGLFYDSVNDVLRIRGFLSEKDQISLHSLLNSSLVVADNDPMSNPADELDVLQTNWFQVRIDTSISIDRAIEKLVMDTVHEIIEEIKMLPLSRSRRTSIIKRLTFTYNRSLYLRYGSNDSSDGGLNLMRRHRDEWSTNNITVSVGNPVKFTYYDKFTDHPQEVIVSSGDLMSFNGDMISHQVDKLDPMIYSTTYTQPPVWYTFTENKGVFRYTLQFTTEKVRQSERLKHAHKQQKEYKDDSDSSDDESQKSDNLIIELARIRRQFNTIEHLSVLMHDHPMKSKVVKILESIPERIESILTDIVSITPSTVDYVEQQIRECGDALSTSLDCDDALKLRSHMMIKEVITKKRKRDEPL
ncbi:hypothetical protein YASMINEVIRUS_681 [Yasminevirus sp. GU-2018]|uniref:Uncharacterized protein n=1 Tax=Yasminevirus sp. GU-2018 TaxID=2420051 RepID=A0A5K0U862_9VIRU|nr:hypothetical protein YASMINEVIRUS_681 [Yasminevirus sp. GU-2018]